jgi:general secretion pathway protein J
MNARGVSLLELLVAVAIFAIVAALAWGGLDALARQRAVLDARINETDALQRAIGQLARDLQQAAPRPARGGDGRVRPALLGTADGLELSVLRPPAGWSGGSGMERVAWRCGADGLLRARGPLEPRPGAPAPEALLAVAGAGDCRWRYLDVGGRALPGWPAREAAADALPRAVELRLRLPGADGAAGGGVELRRVFELPEAWEPVP